MPINDLYSRRNRDVTQAETQDLAYGNLPETVRNQIVLIWDSSIGYYAVPQYPFYDTTPNNNSAWDTIHETVRRVRGLLRLSNRPLNSRDACIEYLLNESNVDNVLDIVEISFRVIFESGNILQSHARRIGITQSAGDAIDELNFRFKEASLGYQFESGQIIRTDSFATHEKIVKPTLSLLRDRRFSGAEDEYREALKHYRARNYRDAITAANSAYESTLKTICEINDWDYDQGDTAGRLLKVVRENGLFSDYMEASFDQLIGTLKSGLTPIRNRESSSHGQGPEPKNPPDHLAEYALNLCAAQILFLVSSMNEATQ